MFFHQNLKEPTKIKISSNKTLNEGDSFSLKLTDMNKTPLSKQSINVIITDKNGDVVVDDVIKTNSKGNAKMDLNLDKGKYTVNVTYSGNENYTGSDMSQNLTVKEAKTVSTSSSSSQSSSLPYSLNNLPPSNDPNPETNRYQVDEYTVAQEYSDHYRSYVDLRTGERHGGFF